ncbi:hypothetical protein G0Q06_05585 [Puniceicoccales bacterium CK1056]|uniref:Asl1-like glycosyl hydrolase catalytic domain-containing protein n=1 Tax=Oceanipulchritudo coccoides TaxID=2706888 RepID=A0A6B2M289_9BACT|nr:glycosyl hydrolase [Oceanipulchritudo coccoides]NDV61915.1 hypothetical protein [Oceanipulchritudo coccoides]
MEPLAGEPAWRSQKRGVSANNLTSEQVALLAEGVSWVYNWGPDEGNIEVNGQMEFLPMIWSDRQYELDIVESRLAGGERPSAVLLLNEPNLLGQAFLTPEISADWITHVHETLSEFEVPLIGPQMSLGSSADRSITAWDPIQQTEVTYTTMLMFLDAYDYYMGDLSLEGISIHPYGNIGELKYFVDVIYERYGQPVWVTEFAFWDAPDAEAEYAYMIQALEFLERSPKVAGYAWFKADLGSRNKLSLLESGEAQLTRLGELYVNFPAFDPDYHYSVPGRIQAEAYSYKDDTIVLTESDSEDGFAALKAGRGFGWVHYQINVAEAGTYRLRVRVTSEFYDPIPEPDGPSEVMDPPSGIERDLFFTTGLQAGEQTLQIMLKGLNAKVDWLEFERID